VSADVSVPVFHGPIPQKKNGVAPVVSERHPVVQVAE